MGGPCVGAISPRLAVTMSTTASSPSQLRRQPGGGLEQSCGHAPQHIVGIVDLSQPARPCVLRMRKHECKSFVKTAGCAMVPPECPTGRKGPQHLVRFG